MIMNSALRKKILAAKPSALTPLYVPDWDATIYIRELTLAERDEFEKGQIVYNDDGSMSMETVGLKARLIVLCVTDENGERLFSNEDEGEVNSLGAAATELVFAACQRVNKMRKQDVNDPLGSGAPKSGSDSD